MAHWRACSQSPAARTVPGVCVRAPSGKLLGPPLGAESAAAAHASITMEGVHVHACLTAGLERWTLGQTVCVIALPSGNCCVCEHCSLACLSAGSADNALSGCCWCVLCVGHVWRLWGVPMTKPTHTSGQGSGSFLFGSSACRLNQYAAATAPATVSMIGILQVGPLQVICLQTGSMCTADAHCGWLVEVVGISPASSYCHGQDAGTALTLVPTGPLTPRMRTAACCHGTTPAVSATAAAVVFVVLVLVLLHSVAVPAAGSLAASPMLWFSFCCCL